MMTLVIGGAASGKSSFAERLTVSGSMSGPASGDCGRAEAAAPLIYLAAMQPFGAEAEQRIRKHRAQRAGRGFVTLEQYTDLSSAQVPEGSRVLLEDLGNLCANEMFSGDKRSDEEIIGAAVRGVLDLGGRCSELVAVTNEVFSGGTDYERETERYLRVLGEVNRRIAGAADRVVEVVCGIPLCMKGTLPPSLERGAGRRAGTDPVEETDQPAGTDKAVDRRTGRRMFFIYGPLCSGKKEAALRLTGRGGRPGSGAEHEVQALVQALVREGRWAVDVQELAARCGTEAELEALADRLSQCEAVISTETGGGVVPLDPAERAARERAGRLNCLLAERAAAVVRVLCGIPTVLKGALPEGTIL